MVKEDSEILKTLPKPTPPTHNQSSTQSRPKPQPQVKQLPKFQPPPLDQLIPEDLSQFAP